jgi:LysR family transcriptional regulator, transcriptional activator of nhaA
MPDWLNYHHLHYFWMVAREGSITAAAEKLFLAQPTLSAQINRLEKSMGLKLFDRIGRGLVLTDTGQMVFRYADEIFCLGRELNDELRDHPVNASIKLIVGVPDVVPKLIVYQLLKPALSLDKRVRIVCYEGKLQELLSDLSLHRLDIVLADSPLIPQLHVRAFNHLLGECGVSIMATTKLARRYRPGFPESLNEAPMLLPTQNTSLRRALENWFEERQIRPDVRHEFEDSAVLKVFGQAGEGMIVTPDTTEKEVARQYGLKLVGRLPNITERFYAISVERRLKHPAVVAICNAARDKLFSDFTKPPAD